MPRTSSQRQAAHDDATEAWAAIDRKSGHAARNRTAGLAEAIRSAATPSARLRDRAALVKLHKARLAAAVKDNTSYAPYRARDNRYFPHQSDRECARRARQIAA